MSITYPTVTVQGLNGGDIVVTHAAFEIAVQRYSHLTVGNLRDRVNERADVEYRERTWVECIAALADFDFNTDEHAGSALCVYSPAPERIAMDDEELFMSIWGSGANQWEWYLNTHLDEAGQTWFVRLDNGEGGSESATLTPASIRRAIESILADESIEYCWSVREVNWADADESGAHVDANIADCIVQYAILGRVIFG